MIFICGTALVIKFLTNQNFHFCHVPDSFTYPIYWSYNSVYQSSICKMSHVEEWYSAYANAAGIWDFDSQSCVFSAKI